MSTAWPRRSGAAASAEGAAMQEVTLSITLVPTPSGLQVKGLTGPLADKVLMLGILEAAKEVLLKWHADRAAGVGIETPGPALARALAGR